MTGEFYPGRVHGFVINAGSARLPIKAGTLVKIRVRAPSKLTVTGLTVPQILPCAMMEVTETIIAALSTGDADHGVYNNEQLRDRG